MADTTTTPKAIYKSKTFWVNIIAAVLGAVAVINPDFLQGLGLGANTQTTVLSVIGAITTILNLVLRLISTTPVTLTGK